MSKLTKAGWGAKYTGNTGTDIFRDSKPITAANLRTEAGDMDDSFLFFEDAPDLWEAVLGTSSDGLAYEFSLKPGYVMVDYNDRQVITIYPEITNVGPVTIEHGTLGAVPILRGDGTELLAGDLIANRFYQIGFDQNISPDGAYMFVNDGVTRTLVVDLSSAEILSGSTSPKVLVPAPGADKIIIPISIEYLFDYGGTPYATHTDMFVGFINTTPYQVHTLPIDIHLTASDLFSGVPVNISLLSDAPTQFVNQALLAFIDSGNPTAGNSTMKIFLTYKVISLV